LQPSKRALPWQLISEHRDTRLNTCPPLRWRKDNGGKFVSESIGDAPVIGAGFGWQLSNRFRIDFTGEYRGTAQVRGQDIVTGDLTLEDGRSGPFVSTTQYQGNLSSIVGLANGYWDMFNFRGFTPYLGAGIGFARNRFSGVSVLNNSSFTDSATDIGSHEAWPGFSRDKTQTNLAWSLMAGTSYDLSSNAKLDIGYRYLNLGGSVSATSSLLHCECGSIGQPLKISGLEAQEFRLGVRWLLGEQQQAVSYQPLK
jgi:opacity protein-like surface antigen